MQNERFKLESCVASEDASNAAGLAAKIAEVLSGQDTQTVLNALVFIQSEFIARQPEASRSTMIKLISDAIEANVTFFNEAVTAHEKAMTDALVEAVAQVMGKTA
jgi:hypothetical protein